MEIKMEIKLVAMTEPTSEDLLRPPNGISRVGPPSRGRQDDVRGSSAGQACSTSAPIPPFPLFVVSLPICLVVLVLCP